MKTGGDDLKGKFYWPRDHYSVPADNLCFDTPPPPDADFRCVRPEGHAGRHQYEWHPLIRDYSHKQVKI